MDIMTYIIALIFDLDGLLVMTEGIYDQMFADYGWFRAKKRLTHEEFETMRAKQFGGTKEQSAKILLEAYGLPITDDEVQAFLKWRQSYDLVGKFKETQAFPGAKDLVLELKASGIPIALATSSEMKLVKAKAFQNPWILDAFGNNIITGDMVENGKPHPESFQRAAGLLGISEDKYAQVLVLEDAPSGVAAAKAAGMKVTAIPDPRLPDPATSLAGADQILTSLTEFQPQQWGIDLS